MPCATVTEREKDGGVLPSLAAAAKALRRAARWSGRGPRARLFPAHAGRSLSATAPPSESVAPRAGPASLGGTAVTGLTAGRLPTAGIGLSRVPVLVAASTASGPAPPCAAPHAPPSHSTHPPAGRTQQEPLGIRVGEGARGPRPAAGRERALSRARNRLRPERDSESQRLCCPASSRRWPWPCRFASEVCKARHQRPTESPRPQPRLGSRQRRRQRRRWREGEREPEGEGGIIMEGGRAFRIIM